MTWNKGIRQTHRWLSVIFTITVIIVTIVVVGQIEFAEWIVYVPLPPLFLLLFTGLYLFVLPYIPKRRSGQGTD